MKVLADIGKNVNSYTKLGSAPSKAAARGKTGISAMGKGRGDAFVVGLIGLIIALVSVFVFYPVFHILVQAFLAPLFAITDAEAPPLR